MSGTMPALVKYAAGEGHAEFREVPVPECGEGQVKIAVFLALSRGLLRDEML